MALHLPAVEAVLDLDVVSVGLLVVQANAYRDAEQVRGDGDAEATRIYANSFNQDKEFYAFTRSLRAYQESFQNSGDIILLQPDSDFFKYLKDSSGGK